MEMRKAGIMVSVGLGGLFLAAALGCGGHVARSAPWITGYQAGATSVQNGLTYQVATVGSTVLILGVNFDGTAAVSFGGRQAASYHLDSSSQISAVVPDDALSGAVVVDNSGGSSRNSAQPSALLIQPAITSLGSVSQSAGGLATLKGVGLYGPASITFTGITDPVTPVYFDPNTLTVAVPRSVQAGAVVLTVNGLTAATWTATVDGSGNLNFSAAS